MAESLKEKMIQANFDYTKPLYHGTNVDFDSDNLLVFSSKTNPYAKEMWDSFYLTPDIERAKEYAVSTYISNQRKGKIIVKKIMLKKQALTKELTFDLYTESNERTVDFIRQNIKKETLANCIAEDKDCYACDLECPRNSDFVYGILCDGVIDDIIIGIKNGMTDEELNKIIWDELGMKRGYQLAVRKSALDSIEGQGTLYFKEDEVKDIIERKTGI